MAAYSEKNVLGWFLLVGFVSKLVLGDAPSAVQSGILEAFYDDRHRSEQGASVAKTNLTTDSPESSRYCIVYNPLYTELPGRNATRHIILDATEWTACDDDPLPHSVTDKFVIVSISNCTIADKALNVQRYGAAALLVAYKNVIAIPDIRNATIYSEVNIPVASIDFKSIEHIKSKGYGYGRMYRADDTTTLDILLTFTVITLLATSTITIGAYWSGRARYHVYSWVLQDLLGVILGVAVIYWARLPNFMFIALLLCLLFVYDIFMVFISPYITSSTPAHPPSLSDGGGEEEEEEDGEVNEEVKEVREEVKEVAEVREGGSGGAVA